MTVNIWKSYIWPVNKDVNMKAILAVLNTTRAVFNKVWTKFKLKQTLEKYGKECIAWKSQSFLLLSAHSLKGHFCVPIWLPDHIIKVCCLKSNMIFKLIKHKKKQEPDQSDRKLTACLIQALSAQTSSSQACLVMLSFWDSQFP